MADDMVHHYEELPSVRAMRNASQKKYGVLSQTRHRALEIKVGKPKCANNKGIDKYLTP